MSSNYLYHTISPENDNPNGFTEFSMVDYVLNFPNRKLMTNSIRLTGNVVAADTVANYQPSLSNIQIDPLVGAHGLFDVISTTFDNLGQIESVNEYARYVKAMNTATTSKSDLFKGSKVCELQAPNVNWQKAVLKGLNTGMIEDTTTKIPDISDEASFSIRPMICLNQTSGGDGSMSFRKSGSVRLTFRVNRALGCLYGADCSKASDATTSSISIKNMKLHFCSVPDDGSDSQLTMSNTINIKSTVQSSFANVVCAVPSICRGVTGAFIRQDRENAGGSDNPLAMENIPALSTLEFLYNNTINNSLVSYQISDYAEILERYVRSVSSSDHHNSTMWEVKHDDCFGIGLDFENLIDLRRQRFSIQIASDISSASPYTLNLFFHGVQTL